MKTIDNLILFEYLRNGLDLEQISDITGIHVEDLRKQRKEFFTSLRREQVGAAQEAMILDDARSNWLWSVVQKKIEQLIEEDTWSNDTMRTAIQILQFRATLYGYGKTTTTPPDLSLRPPEELTEIASQFGIRIPKAITRRATSEPSKN